jgi:type I restriction enzyme S subunit
MDALPSEGLPPGWAVLPLAELLNGRGESVDPARFPETEFVLYSVPAHESGRPERVLGREIGSTKQRVAPGTVLLCKINPRINRVWRVEASGDDSPLIASTEWITFPRSPAVEPEYLRLFLMREPVRRYLAANASGVGGSLMRVNGTVAGALELPLAPLAEQARIVAAVNALFEEVEAGEAALARAREGLTQFRASLLHAACTGALTADWRAANPTNETGGDMLAAILRRRQRLWEHGEKARGRRPSAYPRPPQAVAAELPALPTGWVWATVAQLSFVSGGLTKNVSRNDSPMQLPYLRVANVGEDRIDLTDLRKIGVTEEELPRIALLPGDLLFVEGNGSADQIGRVALWSGQVRSCVHQNHLIKARPVQRFLGRWMRDWFMSPLGKQFVQAAASSTSGLHTLSISKIEGLPVPIPPAAELRRILPRCAQMKREHADGALVLDQQSDALSSLRQSILHAAFTGRLVPQDPADEPAAALLARLRATPAASRRPRARRTATQPDLIETPA